jgi:hypothetical protein
MTELSKLNHMSHEHLSSQQLIANFQTVFVSLATVQAAHQEATRSEQALLHHLQGIGGGGYLQPTALATGNQDQVSQASLDAHIKKVQATQLDSMNAYQLQELQQQTQSAYAGRKVQITVRTPELEPVELVWFDQQHGYRNNIAKRRSFTGVITEVLLDKNALVLSPTAASKLMNSRLHSIVVYIIDPQTFTPMVEISVR